MHPRSEIVAQLTRDYEAAASDLLARATAIRSLATWHVGKPFDWGDSLTFSRLVSDLESDIEMAHTLSARLQRILDRAPETTFDRIYVADTVDSAE